MNLRLYTCDCLQQHACSVQMRRFCDGSLDHRVHRDFLYLGDICEVYVLLNKSQLFSRASRTTLRSALVVWRGVIPGSQAVGFYGCDGSGRLVDIAQGHEVVSNSGLVGLLQTIGAKGTGNELSRGGIGNRRRLMGVERPSVVSWRTELKTVKAVSVTAPRPRAPMAYRLGGSSLVRRRDRATGSKLLMTSSGTSTGIFDDCDSRSWNSSGISSTAAASADAHRRPFLHIVVTGGASLLARRNRLDVTSLKAMM